MTGTERSGERDVETRQEAAHREAELWTTAPQMGQPGPRQGPESRDDPLVDTPMR